MVSPEKLSHAPAQSLCPAYRPASRVSLSTVIAKGIPSSSVRAYLLPIVVACNTAPFLLCTAPQN